MSWIDLWLLAQSALLLILVLGLKRNNDVYRFRMAIIDYCSRMAQEEIKAGRPWEHCYDFFKEVSYHEMVYKFWRPVASFHPLGQPGFSKLMYQGKEINDLP